MPLFLSLLLRLKLEVLNLGLECINALFGSFGSGGQLADLFEQFRDCLGLYAFSFLTLFRFGFLGLFRL